MCDGNDGGSDVPGKAEDGANDDEDGNHQQVKVIANAFLKSTQFKGLSFEIKVGSHVINAALPIHKWVIL